MDKNYIGGFFNEIETQYGSIISCKAKLEDLQKLPVDKYGNIKFTIAKRKSPDKFGNSHTAYEDTYKPKEKKPYNTSDTNIEDVPFR